MNGCLMVSPTWLNERQQNSHPDDPPTASEEDVKGEEEKEKATCDKWRGIIDDRPKSCCS